MISAFQRLWKKLFGCSRCVYARSCVCGEATGVGLEWLVVLGAVLVMGALAVGVAFSSLACVSPVTRTPTANPDVTGAASTTSPQDIETLVAGDALATAEAPAPTPVPSAVVHYTVTEALEGITAETAWGIGDEAAVHVCAVVAGDYAPLLTLEQFVESPEVRFVIRQFCGARVVPEDGQP